MTEWIKERATEARKLVRSTNSFRVKYGKDPMHNNNWRAMVLQESLLAEFGDDVESMIFDPTGPCGIDFIWEEKGIFKGEIKGTYFNESRHLTKSNLGFIAFDKQNDPIRRKQIFDCDAIIYGLFGRDGSLLFRILILGKENVAGLHPLFRKHQKDKIEQIKRCAAARKRISRDDIRIPVSDVIRTLKEDQMVITTPSKRWDKFSFEWNIFCRNFVVKK